MHVCPCIFPLFAVVWVNTYAHTSTHTVCTQCREHGFIMWKLMWFSIYFWPSLLFFLLLLIFCSWIWRQTETNFFMVISEWYSVSFSGAFRTSRANRGRGKQSLHIYITFKWDRCSQNTLKWRDMFDIQGLRGPPGVSGPQGPAGHNVRFILIYLYRDNSVIVALLAKGYM